MAERMTRVEQNLEAVAAQIQFQQGALADSREQQSRQHADIPEMMEALRATVAQTRVLTADAHAREKGSEEMAGIAPGEKGSAPRVPPGFEGARLEVRSPPRASEKEEE